LIVVGVGSILELPDPSDSSDSELSVLTEEARGRSSFSSDFGPNPRVLFCFLTGDFPGSIVLVFALPPRGTISEVRFSAVFVVLLLVVGGFSFTFELERDSERPGSVVLLALSSTTRWNVTVFPFDLDIDRDLDADLDLL
jgi:hypothetical protein